MKKYLLSFLIIISISPSLLAQTIEKIFFSKTDPFQMYENDNDSTFLHYYKLTRKGNIKDVLVILPGAYEKTEDVLKKTTLTRIAQQEGYLVLIHSLNFGIIT